MRLVLMAAALGLAAAIAGCSTVPIGSILPLSRIDPQTTDLAALRVAVQLPAMIRPREGGVFLDVSVGIEGVGDQKTTLSLLEVREAEQGIALPAPATQTGLFAFRLAPADLAALETLRTDLSERARGRKSSLTLNVAARHFCLTGAEPVHPVLATIFVRTSETRDYVVLSKDLDILADDSVAKEFARLKLCPDAGAT